MRGRRSYRDGKAAVDVVANVFKDLHGKRVVGATPTTSRLPPAGSSRTTEICPRRAPSPSLATSCPRGSRPTRSARPGSPSSGPSPRTTRPLTGASTGASRSPSPRAASRGSRCTDRGPSCRAPEGDLGNHTSDARARVRFSVSCPPPKSWCECSRGYPVVRAGKSDQRPTPGGTRRHGPARLPWRRDGPPRRESGRAAGPEGRTGSAVSTPRSGPRSRTSTARHCTARSWRWCTCTGSRGSAPWLCHPTR